MMRRSGLVLGVACILVLALCSLSVAGERFISRPIHDTATGNAVNATHAFDWDVNTFLFFNVSEGNATYFGFNVSDHADGEIIYDVDVLVDIFVSAVVDDRWSVVYSDTNGTELFDLRSFSADTLSRQTLRFTDVADKSDGTWLWSEIPQKLSVALLGWNDSYFDGGYVYVYELYAEVMVDNESPNMTLVSPSNNSAYQLSSDVIFTYRVEENSSLSSCKLVINGSVVATDEEPSIGGVNAFNVTLENKDYYWRVNCTDAVGLEGSSGIFFLTVDANRPPQVETVSVPSSISLSAGLSSAAECNVSVRDLDGAAEITGIVTKLFSNLSSDGATDNASVHHTNSSCLETASSSLVKNYTCGFLLPYYAVPAGWYCNATATDSNGTVGFGAGLTNVSDLWAINITPDTLDYGVLNPGDNSTDDESLLVENIGNRDIDVALWGYGASKDDGLSMVCDAGTIPISYERYSLTGSLVYNQMVSLTQSPVQLDSFDLPPTTPSSTAQKSVYWKMGVPRPARSNCTGFVVVSIVQS